MFTAGDKVLVAVSGGPDSVALINLLSRLREEMGLTLAVAHFDHGLRGPHSRQDAAFVQALAGDLGLPFYLGQGDVKALARAAKISLQMAARRLRLDFLKNLCPSHGFAKLALGHTADDQVELFFLRLLRGAGPEGLKGMWPATPDGLVRPLLGVSKAALLAWLDREGLPFRQDHSNLSRKYLRNRIRLDLLPSLREHYNPRLLEAVWRAQAWLQEEETCLNRQADEAWEKVGEARTPDFLSLNLSRLFAQDPAVQKRLLLKALGRLGVQEHLSAARLANLIALARGEKSGGVLPVGEVRVGRAGGELHFWRHLSPLPAPGDATLLSGPPGRMESPPGWGWELLSRPYEPGEPLDAGPHTARFDLDRAAFPLKARPLAPGDRFWPRGAPGPKKLQDFLVDAKIPRWLRPHLMAVESAGQIIWLPGLRTADPVKITPNTRNVLEIKVSPTLPATQRLWDILLTCRRSAGGEKMQI